MDSPSITRANQVKKKKEDSWLVPIVVQLLLEFGVQLVLHGLS